MIIEEKGRVYTCGSNENAQLGHNKDNRRFNEMEGLDEPIRVVSCGGHHTVLVSTSNFYFIHIQRVYYWKSEKTVFLLLLYRLTKFLFFFSFFFVF